ncbi:hypothetical protein L596_001342 [Steinernema carpocapsae]|uniref:Uncharacterized protein n=1 Tax=Steinernema carpocapsae TaxID=34508 RepID=A0A4U8UKR5_STECR|nr:hypothetical protein L596_001342 [Steinernema carpocapsae]
MSFVNIKNIFDFFKLNPFHIRTVLVRIDRAEETEHFQQITFTHRRCSALSTNRHSIVAQLPSRNVLYSRVVDLERFYQFKLN